MSTTTSVRTTADRLAAELPAMAEAIHGTAVDKGWWEQGDTRDQHEMIALQVSELSEGLEEDREGRPPVWYAINGQRVYPVKDRTGADWTTDADGRGWGGSMETWTGVAAKPEGAAVELADCAIRLMDHLSFLMPSILTDAGYLEHLLGRARQSIGHRRSFGGKKMIVVGYLVDADRAHHPAWRAECLTRALVASLAFAEELGVDPIEVCKIKMAYNGTRPYKHGGKAY